MGDVAFPMFNLQRTRMAPAQIGAMVQETIKGLPFVDSSIVKGPYLNVFFNPIYLGVNYRRSHNAKEDYGQAPAR